MRRTFNVAHMAILGLQAPGLSCNMSLMITDSLPRSRPEKIEYEQSDRIRSFDIVCTEELRELCNELEAALKEDELQNVRRVSNRIAKCFAEALDIPVPPVSVLGARPLEVTETSQTEMFGDYTHESMRIRLWMRTAVQKKPTSYGTFLSTLCHELCHHYDVVGLDLPNTFHTRGFYERAGLLYHHMRGTRIRRLVWDQLRGGRFRINWPRTMRGGR